MKISDQPINFVKLSGSGNDFICLDNRDERFGEMLSDKQISGKFVSKICARGMSVGADGVIFACRVVGDAKNLADISARFFDADGTEVELCGNGTACFARWAMDHKLCDDSEVKIFTSAGIVVANRSDGNYIRVCIPTPRDIENDIELEICSQIWKCDFAITGVPHAVTYVDALDSLDVAHWGKAFRHHERFAPRGVNVNFVQVLGEGRLAVRTFEFGVEGETLACGTGSATAAVLAMQKFKWNDNIKNGDEPVMIKVRSGDWMRVHMAMTDSMKVIDLCLDTTVRFIFEGTLHNDQLTHHEK